MRTESSKVSLTWHITNLKSRTIYYPIAYSALSWHVPAAKTQRRLIWTLSLSLGKRWWSSGTWLPSKRSSSQMSKTAWNMSKFGIWWSKLRRSELLLTTKNKMKSRRERLKAFANSCSKRMRRLKLRVMLREVRKQLWSLISELKFSHSRTRKVIKTVKYPDSSKRLHSCAVS